MALRGRLVSLKKRSGDQPLKLTEILTSASLANILVDSQVLLVPFIAPGVKLPRKYSFSAINLPIISVEETAGVRVHSGFLLS